MNRLVLLLSIFAIAAAGHSVAQEPAEVEALVKQLGADDYQQREEASQRLSQIGAPAMPALRAGAAAYDREIRQRSRRLIAGILRSDLRQRIEAFLADDDPANGYGLPFWDEFQQEYGANEAARKLFVEMQQHESALLQAAAREPGTTADLVEERSQELQQYIQTTNRDAPLGTIVALLAVSAARHEEVSDETHPKLFHFCHQAEFKAAIDAGPRREILRRMVGTLIREADSLWSLYYVLDLAMKYDLEEGLPQALAVLNNRTSQPHIRQLAVLTVGKLGDETHLEAVESLLDDDTRTSTHTINNRVYHQQLRDMALAVAVHLRGRDPREVGFDGVSGHEYMLFNSSTIGFPDDESRRAALEKYAKLRELPPVEGEKQ